MNNESEKILQEIGRILAEDTDYPLDDTLLHAVAAENMVGPSIFKNLGDKILYRDPDLNLLGSAILDLWYSALPEKRWAEMEYLIRNGKFEVKYVYPDEIAPPEVESDLERRDRIVRKYFGDKPVLYPPFDANRGVSFEG